MSLKLAKEMNFSYIFQHFSSVLRGWSTFVSEYILNAFWQKWGDHNSMYCTRDKLYTYGKDNRSTRP